MNEHDRIARKIATKEGAQYPPPQGADIQTPGSITEVETTPEGFDDAARQLQGWQTLRYIAVPNRLVKRAIERFENTKIGVRDHRGRIAQPAQRPKPRRRRARRRARR